MRTEDTFHPCTESTGVSGKANIQSAGCSCRNHQSAAQLGLLTRNDRDMGTDILWIV
ncbi:MAG: hypothetical protein WCL71_06400 [Deltaproteobacteria bacterium]